VLPDAFSLLSQSQRGAEPGKKAKQPLVARMGYIQVWSKPSSGLLQAIRDYRG
jgi:hypothetical protein